MRVVAVALLTRCVRSSRHSWRFTTIIISAAHPIFVLHGCRTKRLFIDLAAAEDDKRY